jgi:hypothetical protein
MGKPYQKVDIANFEHDETLQAKKVSLLDESGNTAGVQHPISVDGDSIYAKDIDVDNSDIGTFTGDIKNIFDTLAECVGDSTATNPKWYKVQLKRPMNTGQMNITSQTGNFSNTKIIFYDASGSVRYTVDDSANNTKYTKKRYDAAPITFSSFKVEFHTADAVCVGFNYVQKSLKVVARMQGLNEPDDVIEDIGSHHKHLKVLGYHESIGHGSTVEDIIKERAMGTDPNIDTGAFTILEEFDFVQPAGNTQMYLQSSSANDSSAGTGIQQVTIEYFSLAWGDLKTVTVTTNGIGQVTISVADIYRIHKMYANKVGSSGVAVGNVTVTNQAANVLYGEISQYHAFMQRCIFYVAENQKITCTEMIITSTSKEGIIGRIFASEEDGSGNRVTRARVIFEIVDDILPYPLEISETVENPNNLKMSIGIAVKGKANDQTATGQAILKLMTQRYYS